MLTSASSRAVHISFSIAFRTCLYQQYERSEFSGITYVNDKRQVTEPSLWKINIHWLLWWVNQDVCLQTLQMSSPSCSLVHHEISSEWFQHYFDPKVTKFWTEVLNIPPEDVKTLVNLDNAPSHPNIKKLCSHDGKIKCLVLPSNTTSMIQPMDHGTTVVIKTFYTYTKISARNDGNYWAAYGRSAHIPGTKSPGQLDFVLRHLIFVGPLYLSYFMSPFWHLEFWGGS
jgi:hypothetical protein